MGVRFISLDDDDTVVAIARNAERAVVEADDELAGEVDESQELGMTGSSDEEGTAE
jgi:hypothetical protein